MVIAAAQAERDTIELQPQQRPERLASIGGYTPHQEGPLPFSVPPHPHDHPGYRQQHGGGEQFHSRVPPRGEQAQSAYVDDEPMEMPRHMQPRDAVEEDSVPLSERAFRAMWPILTGSFILFSVLQMYNVWSQSTVNYNPWATVSVVCITIGGGGALMVLYKWILKGPDGRSPLQGSPLS